MSKLEEIKRSESKADIVFTLILYTLALYHSCQLQTVEILDNNKIRCTVLNVNSMRKYIYNYPMYTSREEDKERLKSLISEEFPSVTVERVYGE